MHDGASQARAIHPRPRDVVRYRLDPATGFEPDLDELEALTPAASLLVLNNPGHPTGAVVAAAPEAIEEGIRRIGHAVRESDERYGLG